MAVLALMDGPQSRDSALAGAAPGEQLLGVGDSWLAADEGFDFSALPGLLSFVDEAAMAAAIPEVEALVGDDEAARAALAGALGLDEQQLDDEAVADGVGLAMATSAAFTAEFDPSSAGPVDLGGACEISPAELGPVPPSTLRARRFAGDPVLEACLGGTHRMLAPEEGRAVLRVQAALLDLGFTLPQFGADGKFANETGTAVSAFKTQHNLQPTDPVVGRLTMGKLDELFADE
jgi:hypothetical protein